MESIGWNRMTRIVSPSWCRGFDTIIVARCHTADTHRMTTPSRLRDSTEIVLPCDSLDGLRPELESEFTVTIISPDGQPCRIIGSPVEIKAVSKFLSRHGISIQ